MKKAITITIAIIAVTVACFAGYVGYTAQSEMQVLAAQVDELTDANERLADMYTDIEAENAELRETNKALADDNKALAQANEALANQEPQVITEYVEVPTEEEWIECGTCGAHVHDWWYVRNMANTEFVEVCQSCYETITYY